MATTFHGSVTEGTTGQNHSLLVGMVLGLFAVAALPIDVRLAHWLSPFDGHLGAVVRLCNWSEAFAHGLGVAMVMVAVAILDPKNRAAIPRLLAASWGAGITADILKLAISRTRPRDFDLMANVGDSFGPLFQFGHRVGQSFPSSHAATAVGLAVGLIWLYPHARKLFVGLAMLACLQRMVVGAHFLSDVLAGAAVGYLFGILIVSLGPVARQFDRWEAARRIKSSVATANTKSNHATEPANHSLASG